MKNIWLGYAEDVTEIDCFYLSARVKQFFTILELLQFHFELNVRTDSFL